MRKVSIAIKMAIGSLVMAIVIIGLSVYSYQAMQSIDRGVTDMYLNSLQPLHQLSSVNTMTHQLEVMAFEYMLFPERRAFVQQNINSHQDAIEEGMQRVGDHELSPEERAAFGDVERAWSAYQADLQQLLAGVNEGQADSVLVQLDATISGDLREALDRAITQLLDLQESAAASTNEQAQQTLAQAVWLLGIVTVVGLAVAIGVAFFISRSVMSSVRIVQDAAQAFAAGDLERRVVIDSGDELQSLGESFNSMADRLQQQIETQRSARQTLIAGTQNISAAAAQILAAVSEHTASANEQSAAINEVSATVSEAQASSQQAAAKAAEVADFATDAMRVGQDGAASVDAILSGMQEIRSQVESIAQNILSLSEQTQQIGDIITTVTDIADQSNILAINAAIEAAKAGEQGKGFAVVAGEVRNLAEQSKQATNKVRSILGEIQKATNTAVLVTEQGTRGVESGVGLTQNAGRVITQLTATIKNAAQSSQQIAAASHQQSIAMDQIVQAMREINQATVQFVAGARQSETAAQGLDTLARDLLALANQYEA